MQMYNHHLSFNWNIDLSNQPNTTNPIFSHLAVLAAWGMIALGLILRLRLYFSGRSLWLDEAMLALNIVGRDFVGLMRPLDYDQGAPLAFLLTDKLVTTLWNSRELALRLFPLLTGCLALIFFFLLVRRILNPLGALAALGLFAVNPQLIYYASEVKQYSSDVFVTVFLLWLAVENLFARDDTAMNKKKFLNFFSLGLVGALSLWFSHPAFFVLAAIGTVLLLHGLHKRHWQAIFEALGLGMVWLTSFGLLYLISLGQLSSNSFLIEYWRDAFGQNPLNAMLNLFPSAAGLDASAPVLLAFSLLGLGFLIVKQPRFAGAVALVFAFAFLAAWLEKYPFAGRLMLFSVPLLCLLLGAGVGWLASLPLRPAALSIVLSLTLAGWLLYPPAQTSFNQYISPPYDEHMRPAMASLRENYKPGDIIYIYYWSIPAFRYYAPLYGLENSHFVTGHDARLAYLLEEIAPLKEQKRVWLLFSHLPRKSIEKRDAVLQLLSETHRQTQKEIVPGTNVYLYLYTLK